MKKSSLLIIGLLAIILFSCSLLRVNALNSNEWTWTYALSSTTYYQGDSGTITIIFSSDCPNQLTFSSLSVQFDWMTTPITETVSSPNIATGNQYTFPAISFNIPSDASVGSHSFTIAMQGQQQELLGWTNISPTGNGGSINVLDAYEKIYNQNVNSVSSTLYNAEDSNYLSPDAQSSLSQAKNMYNQATSLAQQGQWQNAVNDLNTASTDLSQAAAQEAQYTPPPTQTPMPTSTPEFPAIGVLAVFLVLSLFAVTTLAIRKRKVSKT